MVKHKKKGTDKRGRVRYGGKCGRLSCLPKEERDESVCEGCIVIEMGWRNKRLKREWDFYDDVM